MSGILTYRIAKFMDI